jgi:hypothetical protein
MDSRPAEKEYYLADRIMREKESLIKMSRIFCADNHGSKAELCDACRELSDYAIQRITLCPFRAEKPVCAKCPVHCFRNDMRVRIIALMRYAGPRMLYKHPILAVGHLLESFKKPPNKFKLKKS